MKILWLTENYPPSKGGMAQSCDRIVSGLRGLGAVVDILHFTNRRKPFVAEVQLGGSYVASPIRQDIAHSLNLTYCYLEQHLDERNYDFMMIFGGLLPMSAARTFSQLFSLPYYVCIRGNDFDISLFSYKRKLMLLEALEGSRGLLSVSQSKAEKIAKVVSSVPVYYTPNGINLDDWFALPSELQFAEQWHSEHSKESTIVFGLFGVLKEKKGVDYFLRALQASGKHTDAVLLLSGEIQESVRDALDSGEFNYHRLPFLERSELLKYYLVCDWIVIPSFYEGMPNVMLEAGGLKKPVLATAVDGMRDVIEHDVDGILFPPLNLPQCVQAIRHCFNLMGEQTHAMGQALFDKVQQRYTPQQEADNYMAIFNKGGYHV